MLAAFLPQKITEHDRVVTHFEISADRRGLSPRSAASASERLSGLVLTRIAHSPSTSPVRILATRIALATVSAVSGLAVLWALAVARLVSRDKTSISGQGGR